MPIESWDEIRTAYQVARIGTVSGAAHALGVHHATVIRHIDALEEHLGVKLFQRHPRGYTPTEAGADLLKIAQTTDDQFSQLVSRIKGRGEEVSGELVVTSLPGMARLLAPALAAFQAEHPDLIVRYLTGERLFRLEYGEAHVAIRGGNPPTEPDNVVQPFFTQSMGLYVHQNYVDRFGLPDPEKALNELRFVAHDDDTNRAPFASWLRASVHPSQIVFRSTDVDALNAAIMAGAGAGFIGTWDAKHQPGLIEVMAPRPEWDSRHWLVTHVDLHRTPKVQTFLSFLKECVKGWDNVENP